MMRRALIVSAVLLVTATGASAIDDTPANRAFQAERYLETVDSKKMMRDLASQMATSLPAEKQQPFVRAISEELDLEAFEQVMIDSMVEVFTANELAALAEFWGSPVGKSAMDKMPVYMGKAWPRLQSLMAEAIASMQAQVLD